MMSCLGTLNAGLLTSVGMAQVDKSVYALGLPLTFDSYEEVYWVLEKMRPKLEASLEAKGFVVLNWVDGGWTRFFAQKPVKVPDDMRPRNVDEDDPYRTYDEAKLVGSIEAARDRVKPGRDASIS